MTSTDGKMTPRERGLSLKLASADDPIYKAGFLIGGTGYKKRDKPSKLNTPEDKSDSTKTKP
jgi:hypothetical protein